ncbi:MAG: endolytic transglycosylase MltG [Methyloligellaceae bacterium]
MQLKAEVSRSFSEIAANDDRQMTMRPRSPAEALEPARGPERPRGGRRRRSHPLLIVLNGMMTLLVIGALGFGGLIYFAKLQFDKPGPLGHSTIIAIPRGEGVNAIAGRLERNGVISDRLIFVAAVQYFKAQAKLKAGEYEVRKGASMRQVLDTLVQGKALLYKVSVPEGFTSQQVVDRLNAAEHLKGEITEVPPEGSLLPDTYKFTRGMSRQDLIERMQAEQRKYVLRLWPSRARDLPYKTPYEAITMASIVEKETGRADERARIAGVFVNRLRKNMRLQSDPTIIYGIAGGRGTLGRPILRSELEKDTPYNTYKIQGLPPTPIANPGRAAIEAVLNPAQTSDIYFVADGTGGHAFASSLSEHRKNVARWREIEREIRARQAEAERAKAAQQAAANGTQTPAGTPANGGVPVLSGTDLQGLTTTPNAGLAPAAAPASNGGAPVATGPSVPIPLRNPRLR